MIVFVLFVVLIRRAPLVKNLPRADLFCIFSGRFIWSLVLGYGKWDRVVVYLKNGERVVFLVYVWTRDTV